MPDGVKDCLIELPKKYKTISTEAEKLFNEGKFELALRVIDEIENEEDGIKFSAKAFIYYKQKKINEAEKYYLLSVDKGWVGAFYNLANLYFHDNKFLEAEKYYKLAIEKGNTNANNNLGVLYNRQKRFSEAEQLYLEATKMGNDYATYNLAILYHGLGEFMKAEKYYLLAIEKGLVQALFNLASLYDKENRFDEAEKYYLLSIEKEDVKSLNNLAILYYSRNINKATALEFFKGIDNDKNDLEIYNEQRIIIEIWNGIFDELKTKVERLFSERNYENRDFFLVNLLYHQQINLVLNLFAHKIHGIELQKRYTPLCCTNIG